MDTLRYFEWVPGLDHQELQLPIRQTVGSAGYDLFSSNDVVIAPNEIKLIPTGVRVKLPVGEFLAVYARSSLALKHHLLLANGVGVVDADYYDNPDNGGEIFVPLWNAGLEVVVLPRGERIAQGIFTQFLTIAADEITNASKRQGGFGSTGSR